MPETCTQSISFIKQTISEEKIFKDFLENLSFLGPQQPIKISDQDEGHLKRRALLNKHFSKNKTQISPMRKQKIAISTFFHYKSMERISCHGNQSSIRSEQKTIFLVPPSCGCFMPNIKSFGHTASEEMSFEIVDDDGRTTTDGRRIPSYSEPSAQVS